MADSPNALPPRDEHPTDRSPSVVDRPLPILGACGCGSGCSCGCQSGGPCQCGGACGC